MKFSSGRVVSTLVMLLCLAQTLPGQVVISEFMASNTATLADQDGEYSDWIELHNTASSVVNLEGWFLTDSANLASKWRFPNLALPADGYVVVFASGKNRAVAGAQLHTDFSLNAGGEYLALLKPDGTTVASEFAPEFPRQHKDASYGLFEGALYYFTKPSPGAANSAGLIGFVADTKFNRDRGFFSAPFELTISTATTNAVIRYTTNGTPPSLTNGLTYTAPINIGSTTVLRAAAFKEGYLASEVDTQTYIFLKDVLTQAADGKAPPGWPTSWGANTVNYGMDPDVVNNPLYSGTIESDLKTIPSFSMVMDLKDLFDPSRGIYANPGGDGSTWERPGSVELLYPDGTKGFQINAGVRIRGGYSRSTSNPKHAFRWFFREEYGDPVLKYPLFADSGADRFDSIDLRTFQNYSWSFEGDSRGVFMRDQFSRDAQLAMGHQAERGEYYHLYINGQYWGLYNTDERPEASYGATYFGGTKEDYDVVKVAPDSGYTIYATDGDLAAWTRLWNAAKVGFASDAAYQKVQGNNADGTPNPDYEVLLDIDNLIDYMLVILYGGNLDAPISNFLGNTSPNNFFALRNRNARQGFQFFAHDSEHTLLDVNQNRIGPFSAGTTLDKSNPQWFWQQCWGNLEFRMRVADHVQRHFFNGGVLSPQGATNLFLKRKAQIDRAVVGESARWGDSKRATPLTRNVEWIAEVNRIVNTYMAQRTGIVLNQLRSKNLYPSVAAPTYSQHGGSVPRNYSLSLSAPAGTIYYTLDGTDPRLPGGSISPTALTYSQPVPIAESTTVQARAWDGTTWSALDQVEFVVIQTFTELLITELMYNPISQDGVDGDEFEFIELKNVGSVQLDLSGVHFTSGVEYTFPNGTKLGPGQFAILASNPTAFARRYPGVPVEGVYTGRLSNSGDSVSLVHAVGTPIFSVTYGDGAPWPISADGQGFSLVSANPNLNPDPNSPGNWRASSQAGGSPGTDDPSINLQSVWINEVLTHTDPPQVDQIELFNPGPASADISFWFLTDARATPKKFRIPAGTVIPAGQYRVFGETEFNAAPGSETSFRLDSHGEEVYLYSADAAGTLTGYSDGFTFGAAANGVTFGRYVTSTGQIQYPAQEVATLGGANAGPRVGPVVINEIEYAPAPGDEEFIELKNIINAPVKLYDPEHPTNTWKLEGVSFDFPPSSEIPASGLALVVPNDPITFRTRHAVPAGVPVFGPYAGVLQDGGELLQITRPDSPEVDTNGLPFVPYIVVDSVRYNNRAPWPTNAAGFGSSLERIAPTAYGNDVGNWRASFAAPSPGFENDANRVPHVSAGADLTFAPGTFPFTTNLIGTVSDDGQPNPPGKLTLAWTQVSGVGPVGFGTPTAPGTSVSFPGVGSYLLRLTASDGTLQASDDVTVTIERMPTDATIVPAASTWKYLDDGTDQGTAWRTPNFDDSSWHSGRAPLGYGDPETTVIGFGPDSSNKYTTYYFRHEFNVLNAASVKQLTASLLRDDGAVVYLNGIEVLRSNMPVGIIGFATPASVTVSGGDEVAFFDSPVNASALQDGRNVLAVEIHQINGPSSDVSFDLALKGQLVPDNQSPVVSAGPDLSVALGAEALLRGSALDDGLPVVPGRLSVTWSKLSGPGEVTFADANSAVTSARFSEGGSYVLRLVASDGSLSGQAGVTVTVTSNAWADWLARYFTAPELADPLVAGDNADPDQDGLSNLQEFNAGTDPRDARSVLKAESVQWTGAPGTPLIIRFQAMPNKSYSVQCQDAPRAPWIKLTDVPAQPSSRTVEAKDFGASQFGLRFYRIVTPQQP